MNKYIKWIDVELQLAVAAVDEKHTIILVVKDFHGNAKKKKIKLNVEFKIEK